MARQGKGLWFDSHTLPPFKIKEIEGIIHHHFMKIYLLEITIKIVSNS